MAAIHALAAYGDDSDSEGNESAEEEITPDHTVHLNSDVSISKLQSKIQLKSAPEVTAKVCLSSSVFTMAKEPIGFVRIVKQSRLFLVFYGLLDYIKFNII